LIKKITRAENGWEQKPVVFFTTTLIRRSLVPSASRRPTRPKPTLSAHSIFYEMAKTYGWPPNLDSYGTGCNHRTINFTGQTMWDTPLPKIRTVPSGPADMTKDCSGIIVRQIN